jgi:hypothetical protein
MLSRPPLATATPKTLATTMTTFDALWRHVLWGSAAVAAVLIAVFTSLGTFGSQRASRALSSFASLPSPHAAQSASPSPNQAVRGPLDPDAATRQLAQTVRGLLEDRDQILVRLSTLEHSVDDMTGSITQQIAGAKAVTTPVSPPQWPDEAPPIPTIPASIEAVAESIMPPVQPVAATVPLPKPLPPVVGPWPYEDAPVASGQAYGAEIGSATSLKSLHARWADIHAAHGQMFEGLRPVVTIRDNRLSNRAELRLVVGPLVSAQAAAQLCVSLAAVRISCQPTMFDRRHLALQ